MGGLGTSGGDRARVLVVEDDWAHARELAELLTGHYEVGLAMDAQSAMTAAREHHPEAVVLDLDLPDRDGVELLDELLRARDADGAQVLVYSGRDDEQTVVRCLESGAADFVAKPTGGAELVARIDRAVKQGRTERALKRLAQTDALTGLSNYGALQARLAEEVARARRYEHTLSMVVLDLDHLKLINDRHGHEVGNRAILAIARKLKATLRGADFAARFGGDEFVVLLPYQAEQEALVFIERLRAALPSTLVEGPEGKQLMLELTVSAGVADLSAELSINDGRSLMDAADGALYEAKRRGRNCAVGYRSIAGRSPSRARSH